jgi:glycosyltransferase involved in cell wall biosynthesis
MSTPTLCFVVPAHGRGEKTRACLRQLVRTCDAIGEHGIRATAVVVACDRNLSVARQLGLETVRAANRPLGRRWNDGYEYAGRVLKADVVCPLGSDDWLDPVLFTSDFPAADELRCCRQSAVVSEDGLRLTRLVVGYEGGDGVRAMGRRLLERLGYRPAEDERDRAIDTSILRRLHQMHGRRLKLRYFDVHPEQIVDWKTAGDQLNTYDACREGFARGRELDPWRALARFYPREALDDMRAVYGLPVLEGAAA